MAAIRHLCEDCGPATGSPAHGTTRSGFGADTHFCTDVNWKNADDCTANGGTPRDAAPIFFGNNSYPKYIYVFFTGGFTTISSGLFAHTAGAFGPGLTLKGTVTSTYATPATSDAVFSTDMTTPIAIGSGLAVDFSTTGPQDGSPTSTLVAPGYTQYLPTQLLTTNPGAAPGLTALATLTMQYSES